jgi:ribonuclease-3
MAKAAAPSAGGEDLAQTIGHVFKRPALLTEALTHRSALHSPGKRRGRQPPRTYERLEFLGDRVLGLVVADLLWRGFPAASEGELTRRFHDLVQGGTLARVADMMGLGPHLILSPSEAASGARNPGILADVCEAVIAAIYVDGGYDAAFAVVDHWWTPLIAELGDRPPDAKTRLQEWAQARGLGLPAYRVMATEGPSHAPRFTVAASVAQSEEVSATASSKRAAETEAAATLLALLTHDG